MKVILLSQYHKRLSFYKKQNFIIQAEYYAEHAGLLYLQ